MSDSDTDNYATDKEASTSKITKIGQKRKHYKQKFKDMWLINKNFSSWLQKPPKDQYKALCSVCDVPMTAELTIIKRHSE